MEKHEIILPFGFEGKETDEPVRRIVFGKRPLAEDAIKIEDDPQSDLGNQRQLMYARAAMVGFGDKKRAPYLSELLSLKRVDREAVMEGYVDFLGLTLGDRRSEKLDADTVKLAIGLEEEGMVYDLVTLCDKGSLLNGYEEQKIEREAGGDYESGCLLLGYDLAALAPSEGEGLIEGPLDLERIKRLDTVDLGFLMGAVTERRSLFRRTRSAVSKDARPASSSHSG